MKDIGKKTIAAAAMLGWLAVAAGQTAAPRLTAADGTGEQVTRYDEEDGLPHGHVTQMLQDGLGFIWLATWNGLCRYDGYEFRTFKSQAGDGCSMTTDRFRDIALRPDGMIVCRVDDDYYLFDTHTCRFSNLPAGEARQAAADIKRYRQTKAVVADGHFRSFVLDDHQGNQWTTLPAGIQKVSPSERHVRRLDITPKAEVKCLFADGRHRYWVATKDDGAVRVYDEQSHSLLGYLGPDGTLHQQYTRFGASVYCMYKTSDGALWLGCKPDGLYRLWEHDGTFKIDHFTDQLPSPNVYHLVQDRMGRLWIATLGGGLCYARSPEAQDPQFRRAERYPENAGQRVRYLYLADDGKVLLAATTDGLMVSKIEENVKNMRFHRHQRQSDRAESLSSSATMDIAEDAEGRIFVSTESGGVNRIENHRLLDSVLTFRHYWAFNHQLPNDVVMSMTPQADGSMIVVGSHLVSVIDSLGLRRFFDADFFGEDYRFSEAHTQQLGEHCWLMGLKDGAFLVGDDQIARQPYQPRVVLTSISIEGRRDMPGVAYTDTIRLHPGERSLTVRFAAIDYSGASRISYAFRLLPDDKWNTIGHDCSATLLNLEPGVYRLEIRSTDAGGVWLDNVRQLTIVVKPTFWESAWGRMLIMLLIALSLAAIAYTILYIRRIKREQHETLEAYLALLHAADDSTAPPCRHEVQPATTHVKPEDDAMMKRIMTFIEQNIGNSDASVGDMAEAAATSRSGLQRKLKQTMGITPQDLLREARIKHACHLLRHTDRTVGEVAYACGFTDPKYFSRCFKQSVGQSPTEYKHLS